MPSQNPLSESLQPIRLRLPATSANLGPGFDALGLALSLHLTIEAKLAETSSVEATGRDAELCGSLPNNLILMTYTEVLGHQGLAAPAIMLSVANKIPLGMGCGSSAAALLAGVLLANHFGQLRWSSQQILDEACRREGHPDNVAACFYGGLTASAKSMTDSVEPEPTTTAATCGRELTWPIMLALPHVALSTSKARALLPDAYSRADVVSNVQGTALLVSAFALDRPELLRVAMSDRLHQPFRASVCPLLPALLPLRKHPGICGIALSGAGPAVLLIACPDVPLEPIRQAIWFAGASHIAELLDVRIAQGAFLSEVT